MKKNGIEKIKILKKKPFGSFRIPGTVGELPFSLILLTYDSLHRPDIISLLSQWRKKHEALFQVQFPISDERTKIWLEKNVLDISDRVLFFVECEREYKGHVGLFRYNEIDHTIDLDNIVRGKEGGPGLMSCSLINLMTWAKTVFDINEFTVQTTSDNPRALQFYKKLGFSETHRKPFVYRKTREGGEWVFATEKDKKPFKRYAVYMKRSTEGI